jgi:EpsI family protein
LSRFEGRGTPTPGDQISRRSLLVAGGFLSVAAGALAVTPRRHEQVIGGRRLADIIPAQVGSWAVAPGGALILPVADQARDVYDQVLARTYVTGASSPVMLLVAYGAAQSGLMKVHRPEICYAGSGFSIREKHAVDVPLVGDRPIAASSFLAAREDRTERVLYWTRISDAFPRDLISQRLVMLESGLRGVIPDGVLVRCSAMSTDAETGEKALLAFVEALIASAGSTARHLLIGASMTDAGARGAGL